MAISDDFTINATAKTIFHTNGSTVYTVNAFYTYLLEYFDDESTIKYLIPLSAQTPTEYTLINGWFVNEISFQYLKSGAIATSGWNNEIFILYFSPSGYTSVIAGDIGKTVTNGGGTHTGTLLDFDNTLRKWWIRKDTGIFANNDALTITSGTGAGTIISSNGVKTGENQFSNIFTLGSLVSATTLDVYQNDIQVTPWWSTGHIDVLVKVKEAGTEIDLGNLTVLARKYSTLYDHYVVDASSGRNPVPLASFEDTNNETIEDTVSGYSDISLTFAATSRDLGNGNGYRPYDCVIDGASRTVKQIYEYLKYLTRTGSTATVNGVSGEFYTGVGDLRLNYLNESNGPFVEGSSITSNSGATGYITSLIDNGTTGTLTLRNTHGTFADTDILTSNSTTATINGTPSLISFSKQAPFGTFAGGKFFGAQGVFLTNVIAADSNNYQLIDATNTSQIPAVTISITVTGVNSGDRVSVFRATGNNDIVDKSIFFSHASANTSGASTFVTTATIAADTPSSGVLRLVKRDSSGNVVSEKGYNYTSYSVSTFNLTETLEESYDNTDTAYVAYVDTLATSSSVSTTTTYVENRYVVVRVRKKGIVPFTINSQITNSGLSVTAVRTEDTITG